MTNSSGGNNRCVVPENLSCDQDVQEKNRTNKKPSPVFCEPRTHRFSLPNHDCYHAVAVVCTQQLWSARVHRWTGRGGKDGGGESTRSPGETNGPRRQWRRRRRFNFLCSHHLDITARAANVHAHTHARSHTRSHASPANGRFPHKRFCATALAARVRLPSEPYAIEFFPSAFFRWFFRSVLYWSDDWTNNAAGHHWPRAKSHPRRNNPGKPSARIHYFTMFFLRIKSKRGEGRLHSVQNACFN